MLSEQKIQAFDWHRMFIGDTSAWLLLEIAARTAILYLFAAILYRLIGKRALGQLSPYELLVVIALGTGLGDPIIKPEVPISHGMVVIAGIILTARIMATIKSRSLFLERILESSAKLVVFDGRMLVPTMRKQRVSSDELLMMIRQHGVQNLGAVREAYLETNGALSIFIWADDTARSGLLLIPPPENDDQLPNERYEYPLMAGCVECGAPVELLSPDQVPPCAVCKGRAYGRWVPVGIDTISA